MLKLKNKLSSSKSKQKRLDRAQSDAVRGPLDDESLRMSKHVQDEAHRFARNTTMNTSAASSNASYMSDDVEDMFYNGGGSGARTTNVSMRSTDNYSRSTTSSMRSTDTYSTGAGASGVRVTDMYRTTEQMRGTTGLTPLHEDEELRSTIPSTGAAGGSQLDALRAELAEMRLEVQAIRREMMNEMHVTRYDVLKEVTMLKGTILSLVAALESSGGALGRAGDADAQPELSPEELDTISRTTALQTSRATKTRLTALREDASAPPSAIARASARLTQLAPVADDALSTPLLQHQIDELFPLVESAAELREYAQRFDAASRDWAFEKVQDWLDSRFGAGADTVLALVGDGGSGKSVLTAALCDRFADHVAAVHLCQFDRKAKSSPRNVLLSVVNQLVAHVPLFKNQLARLNLQYVLEEADPVVLARKVLLDPLNALDEPAAPQLLVVDGLDQCKSRDRNDLLEFLAAVQPELPPWLALLVTSKPSPELPARLAITSLLDFSAKNASYMGDTVVLVNDIVASFADRDAAQARALLQSKSGGNWTFLDFTRQALSHPGMEDADGYIPLDVLHDLPESIYEIYDEIFEDKFGQGHSRIWKKVQPLLALIVAAASGPYALVTETQAQAQFGLSKDDVRSIRRSFSDIIAVRHGTYRIESSALFDWLVDPQRADEQFYVDIASGMAALRQLHKQQKTSSAESSETHSVASSGGSGGGDNSTSNVSTASSYQSFVVPPPMGAAAAAAAKGVSFKPVGILKKK